MKTLVRTSALVCAFILVAQLAAQTTAAQTMTDALKLRSDMATAVAKGDEAPNEAIGRLRANSSPAGLQIEPDADFAFAAIDVGQRLLVLRRPQEAEQFFSEAEQTLDTLVGQVPDTQAHDKAMFLGKLALIRGKYLNKVVQAKADIEQALLLQPEDKALQGLKATLAAAHSEVFKIQLKG